MSSEPSIPFTGADRPEAGKSNGGSADATKLAQKDSKDSGVGSMGSTQLADMALLITEVKETNRLLKALVAGKSPEHLPNVFQTQNEPQDFQENKKYFEPYNEDELKQITLNHILSVEKATEFREYFLSCVKPGDLDDKLADEESYHNLVIYRSEIVARGRQEASLIVIGREPTASLLARRHQRRQLPWQKESKSTSEPTLAATDVAELVKVQWPLAIAKPYWNYKSVDYGTKNFIHLEGRISMKSEDDFFNHSLGLYYNNDGDLESENIRVGPGVYYKAISQGKIWNLSIYGDVSLGSRHRILTFPNISFISSLLLAPEGQSSRMDKEMATDWLCSFAGSWKPYQSRLGKSSFFGDTVSTTVQHDISFYTVNEQVQVDDETGAQGGLDCSRPYGYFPARSGKSDRWFMESRTSLIFVDAGYTLTFTKASFRIIVLNDSSAAFKIQDSEFRKWKGLGFIFRGMRAGHQLFQATIYEAIGHWERQWSSCLDELEKGVQFRIEEILHTPEEQSLIFDNSYKSSRFYFEVLQLLRLFSERIRETGRDLQAIVRDEEFFSYNEDVKQSSLDKYQSNEIIRRNWEIVTKKQTTAENQLLARITEKTEALERLRDGIMNATTLREASRTTTMNRYIVVFTVVTVMYLPPNFIGTIFATQLFNADEVSKTINKYKISTIVVSLTTYLIASLLVWSADKIGKWRGQISRYFSSISKELVKNVKEFKMRNSKDSKKGTGQV